MSKTMIPGQILQTKARTPEGIPNVVMLVLYDGVGVSVDGGGLAAGARLTFGKRVPFNSSDWEEVRKSLD